MPLMHEITAGLAHKRGQRKGRGESSGRGKTSGRGNKGSKARAGTYIRRGYEGGQTEIYRRFPKRGFSNYDFEVKYHVVNIGELEAFVDGASVDATILIEKGFISDAKLPVKILGNGQLTRKLNVVATWYSKSAHAAIIAAGGTAGNEKGDTFEFPKPKKKFIPRDKPTAKPAATAPAAEAASAE